MGSGFDFLLTRVLYVETSLVYVINRLAVDWLFPQ